MNKNDSECFTLSFPEAKGLVISGNLHVDFNQANAKLMNEANLHENFCTTGHLCYATLF